MDGGEERYLKWTGFLVVGVMVLLLALGAIQVFVKVGAQVALPDSGSSSTALASNASNTNATGDPVWLTIAKQEMDAGVKEPNQRIVDYLQTTTLVNTYPTAAKNPTTHWCAAFVNWALKQAGLSTINDAWANNWKSWGQATEPRRGAVVVFSGHVAFLWAVNGSNIEVLGGNQFDGKLDSVNIKTYPASQVVAYRWPSDSSSATATSPSAQATPSQSQSPNLLAKVLRWLAGTPEQSADTSGSAAASAQASQTKVSTEATAGKVVVKIVDQRSDKVAVDFMPDAQKIAQAFSGKVSGYNGTLTITIQDDIGVVINGERKNGVTLDAHTIKLEGEYIKNSSYLLGHELAHAKAMFLNGGFDTEGGIEERAREFLNLTSPSGSAAVSSPVTTTTSTTDTGCTDCCQSCKEPENWVVYLFCEAGDPNAEALWRQIEAQNGLMQTYYWARFERVDVLTETGWELASSLGVENTPAIVATRDGLHVWAQEGALDQIDALLWAHKDVATRVASSQLLGTQTATGQTQLGTGAVSGPSGKTSTTKFALGYGSLNAASAKGTLGRLGKGDYPVGSGQPTLSMSAEGAMAAVGKWGAWVKENSGAETVVNVYAPTLSESSASIIQDLIVKTGQKNAAGGHEYVLIDLTNAGQLTDATIQKWITANTPHVGFVLDVEWFAGGLSISRINQFAKSYFSYREKLGLRGLGIVGVWYYSVSKVLADEKVTQEWDKDENLQSQYATGIVVPIMDGWGSISAKHAVYTQMMAKFGAKYGGMMTTAWRWPYPQYPQYDKFAPSEMKSLFRDDMLFWCQQ